MDVETPPADIATLVMSLIDQEYEGRPPQEPAYPSRLLSSSQMIQTMSEPPSLETALADTREPESNHNPETTLAETRHNCNPDTALEDPDRNISPTPEAPPTSMLITSPYRNLRASVRLRYKHCSDEVVVAVQRWFSNQWLEKLAVMNDVLGWKICYGSVRAKLYKAKRERRPGWVKVYNASFDESHQWADLLEEMLRTGQLLGIELKLREQEPEPNVSIHNDHIARDHRWSDEQKTALCIMRITYPDLGALGVHLLMHRLFPDMTTSSRGIIERFRRLKFERDPVWLAIKAMTDDERKEHGGYLGRIRDEARKLRDE
ncbi:MAG: hypothetical protein M1839_000560 [Geoglossum umbratile]|nr:MAG: hypothetical protein M1839_000560 [Geoglossum umbratile]